jgi:hypothetical protein
LSVIGIALFERYRHPARWYLPPVLVTYTVSVTLARVVSIAGRASGARAAPGDVIAAVVIAAADAGDSASTEHGGISSFPVMHEQCGRKYRRSASVTLKVDRTAPLAFNQGQPAR